MEEREQKVVHISWEEAYRAEVERDKARQMRCRSIPPTQIEVIASKPLTALSKFNGSAPHVFSLLFSHRHRLSSHTEKMAFSASAAGLEVRRPKSSVSHHPLRSTIAITVGVILLGAVGMLSYSHYNESDLPDPAGNRTTHVSRRDSSEAKVPESSTTHLVSPYAASKTYQSAGADGRENSFKTAPDSSENFEVVDNSFVRDQPEPDATIIATLRPGTQVTVESKTGEYLRVRSLSDADVMATCMRRTPSFERGEYVAAISIPRIIHPRRNSVPA